MTADIALDDARDKALRKIGRNMVNFQKMEAMLKFLNAQQAMSGALKDIAAVVAKAKKSLARQPMGRLAEAFVRSAYSNAENTSGQRDDKEVSVSFSFRIELTPALVVERKRALRSIVTERNKLVHTWLASFDPNSTESCQSLCVDLDEQHARIWPEFETLKAIMQSVRECQRQAAQYVTSDAFLASLKGASRVPDNRLQRTMIDKVPRHLRSAWPLNRDVSQTIWLHRRVTGGQQFKSEERAWTT